jgi:hypothetical protein
VDVTHARIAVGANVIKRYSMKTEILAGYGIEKAFKNFGIKAKRTYKRQYKNPYDIEYEVWELTHEELRLLNTPINWPETWGFWRHDVGSNMGPVTHEFIINGKPIKAWRWYNDEPTEYKHLLEYYEIELGATTEKNVCALSVDLAKQNGLTMAQLFEIYYG